MDESKEFSAGASHQKSSFNTQKVDPKQIRVIWLDVDDTLLDFEKSARDSLKNALEEQGILWREDYFPLFSRLNGILWNLIEQGRLDHTLLKRIRFSIILPELGLDADPDRTEDLFHSYLHNSGYPIEGSKNALRLLSKQYPLLAPSNGGTERQTSRLKMAGLMEWITQVLGSDQMQAAKPDRLFYENALEQTRKILKDDNLQPEQILMIGDSQSADIAGAKQIGCKTIWFCKDGLAGKALPVQMPDAICTTWTQIADLLTFDEPKMNAASANIDSSAEESKMSSSTDIQQAR